MAATPQGPSLEDLFTTLAAFIKKREYDKTLKSANEILAISPRDEDAIRCKVVALVQLSRVQEALSAISLAKAAGIDLSLQKAYCLYRNNQLEEALSVIRSASLDGGDKGWPVVAAAGAAAASQVSTGMLQLEGQILFRMGNNVECIKKYEELMQRAKLSSDSSLSSVELKTNIVAAYVAAGRSNEVPKLMESLKVTPKESFDLAFNVACATIDKGDFAAAEALLLLAQRVGRETLIEEELTDAEVEEELAPLSVQLAFVQQAQDRVPEAMEAYSALLKRKLADAPSMAVASNNLIALRGARELFDALKKFDKILEKTTPGRKLRFAEGLEHKLSPRQKEVMSCNKFLLLLHSSKLDQARELLNSLTEAFPSSFIPAVLNASLLIRENKTAEVEKAIAAYAEKNPENLVASNLVRAQANVLIGNFQKAASVLDVIESMRHKPGMIATLVALRERAGDIEGAEAVLDSAVKWWTSNTGDNKPMVELVTQEAARFKLRHGRHQAAASLFEQLLKSASPSIRLNALHGLVVSTAHFDPAAAEKFEAKLPPLPGLASIDASALERTVSASATSASGRRERKLAGGGDGSAMDASGLKRGLTDGDMPLEKKQKKKKKKKPLYPKGFDPANPGPPPDPERWLPKKERSLYKSRGRKHKNAAMKGSQGAAPAVAAAVEEREKEKVVASTGPSAAAVDGASKVGTNAGASSAAGGARNRRKKPGKR